MLTSPQKGITTFIFIQRAVYQRDFSILDYKLIVYVNMDLDKDLHTFVRIIIIGGSCTGLGVIVLLPPDFWVRNANAYAFHPHAMVNPQPPIFSFIIWTHEPPPLSASLNINQHIKIEMLIRIER